MIPLIGAINSFFRSVGGGGVELDLLALNPTLWLDADDSSTITLVSGLVSQWNDKSGNSNHATQTDALYKPSFITNGINNKDVLSFDFSFVSLPTLSTSPLNYTLILVCRPITESVLEYFLDVSSPRTIFAHNSDGSNTLGLYYNSGWRNSDLVSEYDTNQIICYSLDSNVRISKNAGDFWLGTTYTPQVLTGTIHLGLTHNSITNPFKGYIGEVLLFPSALSPSDREKVEGYLAWKWELVSNLPNNHPYKNVPVILN